MEPDQAVQKVHGVAVALRGPAHRRPTGVELAHDLDEAAETLQGELDAHERELERLAKSKGRGCEHEWGDTFEKVTGTPLAVRLYQRCDVCGIMREVK
jgi:hypothetical protein